MDDFDKHFTRVMEQSRKQQRVAQRFGCGIVVLWLISAIFSLAISCGVLAALVAGVYFLCTGEYIFGS